MDKKQTIKQIYNLKYDTSELNSGLIKWYNQFLDKSVDRLDEIDVSKMIRQDILPELAIDRAIEIFIENPIAGEMYDGDILNMLNSLEKKRLLKPEQLEKITNMVNRLKKQSINFEWGNDEEKEQFIKNLNSIVQ